MFGRVDTSVLVGIDGQRVIVEADYGDGLPQFDMVGFLGSEVKEARERVKAAMKNSGIQVPPGRLTVNLSPANLRKQGNSFDLPIAVAILTALGILPMEQTEPYSFVGELSLDGELRAVPGALSHVITAKALKKKGIILPKGNGKEGAVISGIHVYAFQSLQEVIGFLLDPASKEPEKYEESAAGPLVTREDFLDVRGQESVKRAILAASAGMHGILMIGPPGSGKTLSAKRIPTILPPLTEEEKIECSKIHSVAGILNLEEGLIRERPFRSPHHTVSPAGLVGGGQPPRPGEMSLAHNGVLFLDELPEFSRLTLEVMRQPLEDRRVCISRVSGTYTFPTGVMLTCSANPCRCGYYPDRNKCHCSEGEVRQYLSRISRPLLDRMDILVEVPRVKLTDLESQKPGLSSKEMREKVMVAWEIQKERYKGSNILFNAQLSGAEVRKFCPLGPKEQALLHQVFDKMGLSARAHDRILKVARTLADLEEKPEIGVSHLAEAVHYRALDEKYWGGLG